MSSINKWQKYIDVVVSWAADRSYDVEFHPHFEDKIDDSEKLITINSRFSDEIQLYSLLHECGHLIIRKNEERYNKTYPVAKKLSDSIHRGIIKTKKYQVDVVAEEIDAWRVGKKLAKRLNIRLREDSYNKEMAKWVFDYMEEACRIAKRKNEK